MVLCTATTAVNRPNRIMIQAPSFFSHEHLPPVVLSMMHAGKIHPIATAAVAPVIVCRTGKHWTNRYSQKHVFETLEQYIYSLTVAGEALAEAVSTTATHSITLVHEGLDKILTMTGQILGTAMATAYAATTITAVIPIQAALPRVGRPTATSAITCIPSLIC